jgi:hypothetical protein
VVERGEEKRDRVGECAVEIEEKREGMVGHERKLVIRRRQPELSVFP